MIPYLWLIYLRNFKKTMFSQETHISFLRILIIFKWSMYSCWKERCELQACDDEPSWFRVGKLWAFNTLRPRLDGRHFADDIFTCIVFNENCCILIKLSSQYVRKGPIDNNRALDQIMAWRPSGDKPLSEPMMVSSPTHIGVARPESVKDCCEYAAIMDTTRKINMTEDEAPYEAFSLTNASTLLIQDRFNRIRCLFLSKCNLFSIKNKVQLSVSQCLIDCIVLSYKQAKWYHIPVPNITEACTLLYNYIIGQFADCVRVIAYDRYSSLLWSICRNTHWRNI